MRKKIKRLETKLKRSYFLTHYKPKLVMSYIRCFIVLNLITTLPVYLKTHNLYALGLIGLNMFMSLFAVERRINILFNKIKRNKIRYQKYQNEISQYMLNLYFQRRISKNVYTGYFVSRQKDLCDVELNEFVRRKEREVNQRREYVKARLATNK